VYVQLDWAICTETAVLMRATKVFISTISLHSDGNFIARTAEVIQSHSNSTARYNAARHTHVNLVQSNEPRSFPEPQNLSHAPPDRDLRRDNASVNQAGAIDFQGLSRNGGVVRRDDPRCPRV